MHIFLIDLNRLNVEVKNYIVIEDTYSRFETINTSEIYLVGVGGKEKLKNDT